MLVSSIPSHRFLHCALQGDTDDYCVYNGFDNIKVDEISENVDLWWFNNNKLV